MDVVVLEAVHVFEIALRLKSIWFENVVGAELWENYAQSVVSPLYFFDNVETAVNDELIHVSGLIAKASNAISTSLGSTKFMFEKRIVSCADDGEIV